MAAYSSNATRPNTTCLPFNPDPKFKALLERYGQVDRFLFRASDKYSGQFTDKTWVKSRDAQLLRPSSNSDIFATHSYNKAAENLGRFLYSETSPQEDANFVWWSSSLLVVLQSAFLMAQKSGDRSLANTFICVVDTAQLPARVFMSDTFLMSAFSKYDTSARLLLASRSRLSAMQSLRQTKHPKYARSHNWGQYLSQGALRVEGHCSVVSLAGIVDSGLYALKYELSLPTPKDETLAVSIIRLRERFYATSPCYPAEAPEIESALRIGEKFGPSWKLPIALAFLALKPRLDWDDGIMKAVRQFHGQATAQLFPSNMKVVSSNTLPEVKQFDRLRRCVCEDVLLQVALCHCVVANNALKKALQQVRETRKMRIDVLPLIENSSHFNSLDAVTQSVSGLNKELSIMMKRKVSDSDDDDDDDDEDDDDNDDDSSGD